MVNFDVLRSKLTVSSMLSDQCADLAVIDAVRYVKTDMRNKIADAVADKAVINCRLLPRREEGKDVIEKFDRLFSAELWVFDRKELNQFVEMVVREVRRNG